MIQVQTWCFANFCRSRCRRCLLLPEVKSSRRRKTLLSCTEMKMLKMSIYNKIYTLNKIQRKVDNYNTLILKLLCIHFRVYNSFYYQKYTLKSSIF